MDYRCAIVEEEPLAEAALKKYVSRATFLELRWTASSVEEALPQNAVELLFVAMTTVPSEPDSAFLRLIALHQNVVVTSVYPEDVWDLPSNVVAFLTKPVSFDAFTRAIEAFLQREL